MAVKGQQAKQEVTKAILDTFGDKAFLYNDGKEIRVNWTEAGELCQIKIALTASKVAVEQGGDNALPAAVAPKAEQGVSMESVEPVVAAPSADEKATIQELMKRLGL